MDNRTCEGVTKAGGRCRSFALLSSPFCFMHGDPDAARAARQRGAVQAGRLRSIRGHRSRLSTAADLIRFTADLVHRVIEGELPPDVARCALYGLHLQKDLVETGEIERRVNELVAQLEAMRQGRGPSRGWGA
jgi:hypothetical protein